MSGWLVLVPEDAVARITATGSGWGHLNVTAFRPDLLAAISGVADRDRTMMATDLGLPPGHPLRTADAIPMSGLWYRVDPELHVRWVDCRMRSLSLATDVFRSLVTRGWLVLPPDAPLLVVTHASGGRPEWAVWWVDRKRASPADLELPGRPGLGWDQLQPGWPVASFREVRITVVGAGSIGSAAAHALGAYGVGRIALVDPDRLLAHNLIRHQLTKRHLGMMKVNGLAEQLGHCWPDTAIEPFVLDVAADADRMRPLFSASKLVLCAADGVVARRVVSHLARRADVPAVLACVLEEGEIGEIIRLRPWPTTGCLTCHRQHLADLGSFDPDPAAELPYGSGTGPRPMTTVAGDLQLVGQLAAKVAVATLLENTGYFEQLLPGDHLVVGLRPRHSFPPPADIQRAAEFRWSHAGPRLPGCPTCDPEHLDVGADGDSGTSR